MTEEQIKAKAKGQFPNDEFLQSGVLQIVDKCTAELEKENAELKKLKRECETSLCRAEYQYNYEQLTKAKELLAKWVELFKPKVGNIPPTPIQVDTEQFLKDLEK